LDEEPLISFASMFRSLLRSGRFNLRRFSSEASAEKKESYFQSDAWIKTVGTIGALANWTIPLAGGLLFKASISSLVGIAHIRSGKDPSTIDPYMTANLMVYSCLFMRWSLAITPANGMLFVCHLSNEFIQIVQMGRYLTSKPKK